MGLLLTISIICSSYFHLSSAFPTGAPEASCLNMFPKHKGAEQQTTDSPFSITLGGGATTYTTANITVTIGSSGGRNFKGVDIRARRVTGDTEEVLGSFFTAAGETLVHTVDCLGGMANMVTHTTNANKTDLILTWQPPASSVGNIVFTATFVADFSEFWTDVRSPVLTNASPNPNTGSLEAVANVDPQIKLAESCGESKGCFLVPPDCTGSNCDAAVSYKTVGNTVEFEMFGKAEGWVSVGFSEDKKMGMDETVTCTAQGSRVTVQRGFNPEQYNERLYTNVLTKMRTIWRDDKIYCHFTRPMETRVVAISYNAAGVGTPVNRTYDLKDNFYMLLGWGHTYEDTDVVGKHTDTPAITKEKVNFKSYDIHTTSGKKSKSSTGQGIITVGKIQNTFVSVVVPLLWCRALYA